MTVNNPLNSMRPNNAPRPLWPWIVGATALFGGGYTYFKRRNVDVYHKHGNVVRSGKTGVEIREKP